MPSMTRRTGERLSCCAVTLLNTRPQIWQWLRLRGDVTDRVGRPIGPGVMPLRALEKERSNIETCTCLPDLSLGIR